MKADERRCHRREPGALRCRDVRQACAASLGIGTGTARPPRHDPDPPPPPNNAQPLTLAFRRVQGENIRSAQTMTPFIKALESNRLWAAEKSGPLKQRLKKNNRIFSCKGAKIGNSLPEAFARLKTSSEKSFQLFSLYIRMFWYLSLHDIFCNIFCLKTQIEV